jgi:hypothetical protein
MVLESATTYGFSTLQAGGISNEEEICTDVSHLGLTRY